MTPIMHCKCTARMDIQKRAIKGYSHSLRISELRSCVKVEVPVPNSPYGLCGRKATLEEGDNSESHATRAQ